MDHVVNPALGLLHANLTPLLLSHKTSFGYVSSYLFGQYHVSAGDEGKWQSVTVSGGVIGFSAPGLTCTRTRHRSTSPRSRWTSLTSCNTPYWRELGD